MEKDREILVNVGHSGRKGPHWDVWFMNILILAAQWVGWPYTRGGTFILCGSL